MSQRWRPCASIAALKSRSELLAKIRQFFAERGVWEVSTPILSSASITDPNIESLQTKVSGAEKPKHCYLQTSPEFPMKRLLAAGSGAIYQICSVFRDGELGRYHNPEFTLLEWYRPDFDHHLLMDEIELLLQHCFPPSLINAKADRISYRDAFLGTVKLDPLQATVEACRTCCEEYKIPYPDSMVSVTTKTENSLDQWLDLILSHYVGRTFTKNKPTFLYDYPASQAALAQVRDENDYRIASRFELFWGELELANGFHELSNADEQLRRFEKENEIRLRNQQKPIVIDQHLLNAMKSGMPNCAGVAIGVDRLLMIMLTKSHIRDVLAFPFDIA